MVSACRPRGTGFELGYRLADLGVRVRVWACRPRGTGFELGSGLADLGIPGSS